MKRNSQGQAPVSSSHQPAYNQPDQAAVIADFLEEANILLDEIGRFHRVSQRANVANIGDAAERLLAATVWAEALVQHWANLVPAGTEHRWSYLLLRSHARVARQIITHWRRNETPQD